LAYAFKHNYARAFNLDFDRLLNDREYKEARRTHMNDYFEKCVKEDKEHKDVEVEYVVEETHRLFEKQAHDEIKNSDKAPHATYSSHHPGILIVSDFRLLRDIPTLRRRVLDMSLVRISRSEESKLKSGWKPDEKVDKHFTEVDLDSFDQWDHQIDNSGSLEQLDKQAEQLVERILKLRRKLI
jgi:recombinational DNA repair ATPase RecF